MSEPEGPARDRSPATPDTPLFRWSGHYWGFLIQDRILDRYGRHVGWIEPTPSHVPRWRGRAGDAPRPSGFDVYLRDGHFLGELCDGHYVLRSAFRADPVPHAARAAIPHPVPPAPVPDREERDPIDGWRDVLPWPLRPPVPPRL